MSLQYEYCSSESSFRSTGAFMSSEYVLFQPRPDFSAELFLIFRVLIGEIHPLPSECNLIQFWTLFK